MLEKPLRRSDRRWGPYGYPVTRTQFAACNALQRLLKRPNTNFFCSQRSDNGTVTMGVDHRSVDIRRDGRVYPNASTGANA